MGPEMTVSDTYAGNENGPQPLTTGASWQSGTVFRSTFVWTPVTSLLRGALAILRQTFAR